MRNNQTITNGRHQKARPLVVLMSAILLAPVPVWPQKQTENRTALTEDQRISHLLNRIAFGARPGDIGRVKAKGLRAYIEQQLSPEKISDSVAESKVRHLDTLNMSTAQLYEKFPQPGQLLRELQRQGLLPSDLAEARREPPANRGMEMQNPGDGPRPDPASPMDNEKVRRAIREYYEKNGLQPPQRIMAELQASRILRAVYSERQLHEVMVDFWTNHFNVFAGKGADRWLLTAYDRDTIRPHALGKFSDLLLATAKSPAMLFYLDNFQSVSPNMQQPRRGVGRRPGGIFRVPDLRNQQMERAPAQPQRARRGLNENYARELMELHTIGVDGGYTQKDVQEVARCFTGWTILAPRGAGALQGPRGAMARENAGTFFFNPRVHDDGEKIVLGHKIPAGGGMNDGLKVLEILANHPSTAKFIATKLVVHLVSDEPPASLVDRVAATYKRSGGDIREMLRTLLYSEEFNSSAAYRAKIKRPFELAVSTLRTLGAETNGGPQLHRWIAQMGEPLYGFQAPTGYSDTAESWVTTGGLLERMNFGLAIASNRVPGTRVDLKRLVDDSEGEPIDRLLKVILGGEFSTSTRAALMKQVNDSTSPLESPAAGQMDGDTDGSRRQILRAGNVNDPRARMVGLILGSPEFQRQ